MMTSSFTRFAFNIRNCFMKRCVQKNFMTISNFLSHSTVDPQEVDKFDKWSESWWDKAPLRTMNLLRVPLIRDGILSTTSTKVLERTPLPLKNITILDVGCGGGILSEPLARLGASVTGLDPGPENISAAIRHASKDESVKDRLEYVCGTVESFQSPTKKFDAVVCSEVIEHVDNVPLFVQLCTELVKDNGSIFFTTPNKTNASYVTTILLAEYVFGIIPKNTHDWNKFVPHEKLIDLLESNKCTIVSCEGMIYNPIVLKWSWSQCNGIMVYALHAVKDNAILQ